MFFCINYTIMISPLPSGLSVWISRCFEDIHICICCILWIQASGMVVKSVVIFWEIIYVFLICSASTNIQPEDSNPTLMLDILCKIYRGEVWMYNPSFHSLLHYHDICQWSFINSRTAPFRNHCVFSFGTRKVLLTVQFGLFFAT